MSENSFLDKLNDIVDWDEINMKNLARNAGVGYDTVREIARGRTQSITVDNAKRILDILGLSFQQIYLNDNKKVSVPRYKAMLAAGHGGDAEQDNKIIDYIPFTPRIFFEEIGQGD